jgi:DNA-binding transcriptional regulator YdaS (Cro superfamily)
MFTHALGGELRLDIDWRMARTAVCRSQEEVFSSEEDWKRACQEKGWE